ncbi:lipopolysaccharide biosynthesis protein [Rubrivivax gelatinosus]|uniref:lipopolysaccharide biosynthesis protein n=1 Tax=Rubrivivax gelatinosus TaxID=28068 RepID=UPI0018CA09F9|nr:oligosaccharide flippase family protein [Rubrivivax gelatinosus]
MTPAAARVWSGPARATALEALSLAAGFVTQLLLMRRLGPGGYGECVLAVAVGLGITTLTDFGFNIAGTRQAVGWADDAAARHRLFWSVTATKACVGLVAVVLLALLPGTAALLPAAAASALGATLFPTWYLTARGRLVVNAAALLGGRLAMLLAVAALVRRPADAGLAAVLNCLPALAALMLVMVLREPELRAVARPLPVRAADIARAARMGLPALWISAVPAVGSAMVQALIGHLGSTATLGQYAAADKVRAGIQGLFTALGQALFPGSVARHADGAGGARLAPTLLGLAGLAALPMVLAPQQIIAVVAGPGYEAAAGAMRVMGLAVVSSAAVTAFGLLGLLARGLDGAYVRALVAGLAAQAAALALLVPAHGATGAAWTLVVADAVALTLIGAVARRR